MRAPAAGTRAHHVLHWADGGPSDLDNAALLCQRHHTVVHQRRLWARVRDTPDELGRYVVWDLHDGGYDRHLAALHRERAAHDPPPLTRERLHELLAALADTDPHERRWAALELDHAGDVHDPDLDEPRLEERPWEDEAREATVRR